MANEKFPEVERGGPISAARANTEGRVLERMAQTRPGSGMDGRHGGSILQFSRTLDARLASLTVTDDTDAPVYLGVLRQYNFQTDAWTDGEKLWKIDAGAVNTTLSENSVVVAYYDRKRGAFIPVIGAGGAEIIRFEVVASGPFLGDVVPECDFVTVEVLNVLCQGSGVLVGDEVRVWDTHRCHFNIPIEVLIGAIGWAVRMVAPDPYDAFECLEQAEEDGSCRWEVQILCCTAEIYGG